MSRLRVLVALVQERSIGEVEDAGEHRQVDGGSEQLFVRRRERAAETRLVVAGDAEVLAAAVPCRKVQGRGRDCDRMLAQHQRVRGDDDRERDGDDIERHSSPQAATDDGIVGGAEVKLREQEIRCVQLTAAVPVKHQRHRHEQGAAAGAGHPEVCGSGEKPGARHRARAGPIHPSGDGYRVTFTHEAPRSATGAALPRGRACSWRSVALHRPRGR